MPYYHFNTHNVCTNPDTASHQKTRHYEYAITVAVALDGLWRYGLHVTAGTSSMVSPCSATGTPYPDRAAAIEAAQQEIQAFVQRERPTTKNNPTAQLQLPF